MNLPHLPQDKANHFIYGAVITSTISCFKPVSIAFLVCIAIALAKEIYDLISEKGTPEFTDFIFTVVGSSTTAIPLWYRGV
jgi:hypothetical protein